jgi:hypothetical protein
MLALGRGAAAAFGGAVNPRHRHHVAGGQLADHPVKLAPVGTPFTFSR